MREFLQSLVRPSSREVILYIRAVHEVRGDKQSVLLVDYFTLEVDLTQRVISHDEANS